MALVSQWFIACALLLWTSSVWSHFLDANNSVEETETYLANASSVFFNLYTRQNPFEPQILRVGDLEALQQSNYMASLPTKMVAHGYNGDPGTFNDTKDEFLQRENCNFITIDWVELASGIDYPSIVTRNVPLAASETGAFVDFLYENTGATLGSFHLIGFSLGAHVVGGAGAAVVSGNLPRITGLDPAAPGFSINDTETRLDTSDADFVDIIHTNSGPIYLGDVSMEEAIGHVDFYPNGGQKQPGCLLAEPREPGASTTWLRTMWNHMPWGYCEIPIRRITLPCKPLSKIGPYSTNSYRHNLLREFFQEEKKFKMKNEQ